MSEILLVLVCVPDEATAKRMAMAVVEQRLAACVSIQQTHESWYWWQGKIERAQELTLFIKTSRARYASLETALRTMHPYQVPEIISMPVNGLPSYLEWVLQETSTPGSTSMLC